MKAEHSTSNGTPRFFVALIRELVADMNNWYGEDNYDRERFGAYQSTLRGKLVSKANNLLSGKAAILPAVSKQFSPDGLEALGPLADGLEELYELLGDDYSRSVLVKVMAYRLLGPRKVKLPLNTPAYWSKRSQTLSLIKGGESIEVGFPIFSLKHFDLNGIGYPLELYFAPIGVMTTFILKQYEYGRRQPPLKARAGDYVIDGGGCWGDTALYFANEVGEQGRVYTFEFAPENLKILERNVQLNEGLSRRVEVVRRALWDSSGQTLPYNASGPGTSLAPRRFAAADGGCEERGPQVSTAAIDDFVRERNLPRIDFIKMDIEGSELNALRGAEGTLKNFRPRLAISVYHKQRDLVEIPAYLRSLDLGYEFFLDHFTIYGEETVLFAVAP